MAVREISQDGFDELAGGYHSHLFISNRWLSLLEKAFLSPHLYILEENNQPFAAWPLFFRNFMGLRGITHPPLTPYLGVACQKPSRKTTQAMSELLSSLALDYVYLAFHPHAKPDLMPFKLRGFQIEVRLTFLLDLDPTENELWKSLDKTRRGDIRRAQKDGLSVKVASPSNAPVMLALIRKTFERQGMVRKESWFALAEQIVTTALREEWGQGWIVYRGNRPLHTIFVVWDRDVAYYLLGGYDHTVKHHGAGPLAMWHAILFAKKQGLRWFDFEGSEIPSIERYIRKFGGILTPYYAVRYMSPRFQLLDAFRRWWKRLRQ